MVVQEYSIRHVSAMRTKGQMDAVKSIITRRI